MDTIIPATSNRNSPLVTDRLVERDRELAVLRQCLDDASAGAGGTVFCEAPPGGGKTRLLAAAHEIARESGMRVLTVAGAELERECPFCLAMRLFESIAGDDNDPLLQHDERPYSVIHGLFQATEDLVGPHSDQDQGQGLAILIDDAHFADPRSLRFLAYLAERVAELPIAIVIAATPGRRTAEPRELATLRRAAGSRLLRLAPLGMDGVAQVVRASFPQADAEFSASCARASGGNPFLLTELLAVVADDEQAPTATLASGVGDIVPDRVREMVAARLESVPPATRAVAEAVAVLGEAASVGRVALLAGVESDLVLTAARELADSQLLAAGTPLSFAQPMLGTAISASLGSCERSQAHLRAARILAEQNADPQLIAEHLLQAPAVDDPAAAAILHKAAEAAIQRDQPERAIRLLSRALAEHPPPALKIELLAALASAEAEAGLPHASERLSEAWRMTEHPERRAELALALGRVLYSQGNFRAARDVLRAGLDQLDSGELASELRAARVMAAALVPELGTEALAVRNELIADPSKTAGPRERAAIAHTLVLDGLRGAPRRTVGELAELAWGDGALLSSRDYAPLSVPLLATGLLVTDDLERVLEICDSALHAPGDATRPLAQELLTSARAWGLLEQGRVITAEAAAAAMLDRAAFDDGHAHGALAALARCHVEQGRLDQADTMLAALGQARDTVSRAVVLDVRAQLRLAQHRPQDALQDAMHAGAVLGEQFSDASPGATAWRSTAALAHLALGDPERAQDLVEDELERARNLGVTRIVIRDLRILGLALGREGDGIERLAEAVALGRSYPNRLEYVRALIDYGAALRRAGRRRDAREPLRLGLDLSHRGGASVLEARARAELVASGARPRRAALIGLDSLTTSQRRVANLAAAGLTTRQIAAALFVTPKTVEFHLRNIYSKLGIASREELAKQLSGS